MKRTLRMFSLLLSAALLLALVPAFAAAEGETITVTDHAGFEVTVPAEIDRIVVCDIYPLPSVLSVFFDSAEKIVGMPQQSMAAAKNGLLSQLFPEILSAETEFIDGTSLNMEELLKLEPDVVFYSADDAPMGEAIREFGIPAVAISASNWDFDAIETLNQWIALLSQIFPGNDKTQSVADASAEIYARVQERVADLDEADRRKVFFLFQYNESTITTSGRHFFGQYWADAIGAVNVGAELDTFQSTPVTLEQVYEWNPQNILISNYNTAQPDDLYGNTVGNFDWSAMDAVVNHCVHKMPLGMYRSYTCGVDTPVTLLWLAQTVYPELFADIDIIAETQSYYQSVFGIDLTAEQAAMIFAPASAASAY